MEAATADRTRRLGQLLCAGGFLIAIYSPLVDQLVRPSAERDSRAEFRAPAPPPPLSVAAADLDAFPERFEAWFKDTFGLRDHMLRWHNALRWFVLYSAPDPSIVRGKRGWLFSTDRSVLEDHRGALTIQPVLLEEWRLCLERRRAWLSERGIDWLFALVPYKNQAYPEFLPARFAPIGPTRLEQLLGYLHGRSDLPLLDLRSVLQDEKRRDHGDDWTYFPLGTHWTQRGAYRGYAALIERLPLEIAGRAPLEPEAFAVAPTSQGEDNWAGRLYMQSLLPRACYGWTLREPHARLVAGSADGGEARYERSDDPDLPRGFFIHDSFGLPLRPWLAEHFSVLDCVWTSEFDSARIAATHPDVVIQLQSEYTLFEFVPQTTMLEDDGSTRARFEACTEVLWSLADPSALDSDSPLSTSGGGIALARGGPEEFLRLPPLAYPPDRALFLKVEVESPRPGPLQVFYQTVREPAYDRRRALLGEFEAGRSSIYLKLPPLELAGGLGLRIGHDPGTYVVNSIEIRTQEP